MNTNIQNIPQKEEDPILLSLPLRLLATSKLEDLRDLMLFLPGDNTPLNSTSDRDAPGADYTLSMIESVDVDDLLRTRAVLNSTLADFSLFIESYQRILDAIIRKKLAK